MYNYLYACPLSHPTINIGKDGNENYTSFVQGFTSLRRQKYIHNLHVFV